MIIIIGDRKIRPAILVEEALPTQKIGWSKKPYYALVLKGKIISGEETKGPVFLHSSTLGPFFMYKTPTSYRFSARSPINILLKLANVSDYRDLKGLKLPVTTEGRGWLVDLEDYNYE